MTRLARARHRERLVLRATPLIYPPPRPVTAPLELDTTDVLPVVEPEGFECRCGHAASLHRQVGFYAGEKERCGGCDCRAFRHTWSAIGADLLRGLAIGLPVAMLLWALILWVIM